MELIEVKNNKAFCDSSMVARKFGIKHNDVTKTINRLLERLRGANVTPKVEEITKEYRGQIYTAYLMDRDFFMMLAMRFETNKAIEWQSKFINAFNEMENKILKAELNKSDKEFIQVRSKGKQARLEETDVIKEFVEYATKQGSGKAKFYYKHITNATYQALELMVQKKPKLRDTLDIYQLSELLLAERVVKNSLKKYMELGRHYKDVYKCVADDLTTFGNSLKLN